MKKIITIATVLTLATFSACTKNSSDPGAINPAPVSVPAPEAASPSVDTSTSTAAPSSSMGAPADGTVGSGSVSSSTSTSTHMGTKSKAARKAPTDNSESNRTYPNNDMGGENKKPKH